MKMFYRAIILMLLLQSDFLSIVHSCWNKNKSGAPWQLNCKNVITTTTPATTENSTINLENFLGLSNFYVVIVKMINDTF